MLGVQDVWHSQSQLPRVFFVLRLTHVHACFGELMEVGQGRGSCCVSLSVCVAVCVGYVVSRVVSMS